MFLLLGKFFIVENNFLLLGKFLLLKGMHRAPAVIDSFTRMNWSAVWTEHLSGGQYVVGQIRRTGMDPGKVDVWK